MSKLKSAVIGCGRMGAFTSESVKKYSPRCWLPLSHIEALIKCQYTSLESVCDINEDLLNEVKSHYKVKNIFKDYKKMLEVNKPDILTIATRTTDRSSIIKDTINAGVKAIHTEKPFCNSMLELTELSKLINDNKILITYGTIRRYFEIYAKAKKIVDNGDIGDLQEIEINFGSAQLFWSHPHSVDTILFFADSRKVVSVEASLTNVVHGEEDDLIISDPNVDEAKIIFDDGCVGRITSRPGMDVTLYCSKGRLVVEGDGRKVSVRKLNESMAYFENSDRVFVSEEDKDEGTMSAIEHLVYKLNPKIVADDKVRSCDNKHILTGQHILFGFIQSHLDGGTPISLNDVRASINVLAKTGEFFA